MCGTTGYFVGCDIADQCPHKGTCSLVQGRDALHDWYEKASVRRAPRRTLNEEDIKSHIYPYSLAPTVQHNIVQKLDGERIIDILNNNLFRYLDFTIKLELAVVNDVMSDLAFGHTPIRFDEETQLSALKIYTDEGYHALFSMDLFNQAKKLIDKNPIVPKKPAFMRSLHSMINKCDSEHEKNLTKLFFVATSEALITSSLTDIRKNSDIPEAIRKTISDHAIDEARHHTFFRDLIEMSWPHLDQVDRNRIIRQFPDFIFAFVQPDIMAIHSELVGNGISASDAEIVIAETYTADKIANYARLCANALLKVLKKTKEFNSDSVRELYESKGLV